MHNFGQWITQLCPDQHMNMICHQYKMKKLEWHSSFMRRDDIQKGNEIIVVTEDIRLVVATTSDVIHRALGIMSARSPSHKPPSFTEEI